MFAHVKTQLPPMSTVRADVPASLDRVLARALAREPDARYPTARGLADALRSIVATLPDDTADNALPASFTHFALPTFGPSTQTSPSNLRGSRAACGRD
jgi:hypothetical protein